MYARRKPLISPKKLSTESGRSAASRHRRSSKQTRHAGANLKSLGHARANLSRYRVGQWQLHGLLACHPFCLHSLRKVHFPHPRHFPSSAHSPGGRGGAASKRLQAGPLCAFLPAAPCLEARGLAGIAAAGLVRRTLGDSDQVSLTFPAWLTSCSSKGGPNEEEEETTLFSLPFLVRSGSSWRLLPSTVEFRS